ncbi:hypothetical protein [Streptomyces sp. NPDC003077]|uniref:hypothetical protein n=1 Tax=Streptomyces sp. NPDC003077 TaxID=3154443 RepID=UPI0033B10960
MRGVIGFIVALQGALGFLGQVFTDGNGWGVLPNWVDLSPAVYLAIAALGLALLGWDEADRRKKRAASAGKGN